MSLSLTLGSSILRLGKYRAWQAYGVQPSAQLLPPPLLEAVPYIDKFFFKKRKILHSYLTAPGLSCGMWDLVLWPGIRPVPLALGTRNLSHWTSKKVSSDMFWFILHQNLLLAQSWYNRSVFSFAKVFCRPFCPLHSPKMLSCIILCWIFKIWNSENQSSLQ